MILHSIDKLILEILDPHRLAAQAAIYGLSAYGTHRIIKDLIKDKPANKPPKPQPQSVQFPPVNYPPAMYPQPVPPPYRPMV
jgi:hypothetical protein